MTDNPKLELALAPYGTATDTLPSPTPTYYSELAKTLIAMIDQVLRAATPDFETPTLSPKYVARKLRVPPDLISHAFGALLVHPELKNVDALDAATALRRKQYIDAFIPVIKHMDATLKAMRFNVDANQALIAASAEQIYGVAKALARDRETASLSVFVGNMKRALRAARRPRRRGAAAAVEGPAEE